MATEKYQNKYRIASTRMKNYDYASNGAYFITIVTKNRKCFFGNIVDGKMALNEIGKIVKKEWLISEKIRKNIFLDEFVIMPNHFHGIVIIDNERDDVDGAMDGAVDAMDGAVDAMDGAVDAMDGAVDAMDGAVDVMDGAVDVMDGAVDAMDGAVDVMDGAVDVMDGAVDVETLRRNVSTVDIERNYNGKNKFMSNISPKKSSLSHMIREFKSIVTRKSHKILPNFAWQPRFHDRIIRNENELNRIRNYIIKNPEMWRRDRNNGDLWL